ncbi:MAG: polyhydroxyalkanoic acid synthase [Rhizobiales bacterium]|nr:polyhydroxyalkanoic acid synthase [Hyphomicrobiales bacterium]
MRPASQERALDQQAHALIARLCGGLSPFPLAFAWADWAAHLAISPGRQFKLAEHAIGEAQKLWADALPGRDRAPPCLAALDGDRRFMDEAWMLWPYCQLAKAHLAIERWWGEASRDVHGARPESLALVGFVGRQLLDLAAPSNALITNPEAILRALNTKGQSLHEGFRHWLEDLDVLAGKSRPAGTGEFVVGEAVATTPGKIVARTSLAEIIQYTATTERVHAEPIVIVPAWIMKYYILDLRPENSLVKHLVGQGFTVFMVSWKNPTEAERDVAFDEYRTAGAMAAIEAACAITGARRVHAVGYCLGGTLLAITAAAMARDGDDRLRSLTLLASLADFHEAGELRLFISDSQLALLEDMMNERGYLEGPRMMGSFNLLRANDLIWSRMVREYMMGERRRMVDVAAWSQDATRMPARMHAEYLRSLYLNNDLMEGRFEVAGSPVALQDIEAPVFVLGTEWDHIAPWRAVYKIHLSIEADVTFALTNGGHNQGVVSPPETPGRHHRIATKPAGARYIDPDAWFAMHEPEEGSWWTGWFNWLKAHSSAEMRPSVEPGAPHKGYPTLGDAPGDYVKG